MATAQSKKALRKRRKEQGLCIHCGDKAKLNQTRCARCITKDKENRRRYAERDAKRGICKNTGCSNAVTAGRSYCDECNAASSARTSTRRQGCKAKGICVSCETAKAVRGTTRCEACNTRMQQSVNRLETDRLAHGKCRRCGDNVLEDGYRQCRQCIDKGRARHAALKLQVLDAYGGPVCVGCGEAEIAVLQIDHIGGGGHAHAFEIGNGNYARGRAKMYPWLRDNGFPAGYRVLCANCNIRAARDIQFPNS